MKNNALLSNQMTNPMTQITQITQLTEIPTYPALIIAFISIISKEWLYLLTKRIGNLLNSQIIIANAWHHRSDAFSSILSFISISFAILLPQYVFIDSLAGILIAGMICFSGIEILIESIKQLTDSTSDIMKQSLNDITQYIESIDSVFGVRNIRTRTIGNKDILDLIILIDNNITINNNEAYLLTEKIRYLLLQKYTNLIEISIKTISIDLINENYEKTNNLLLKNDLLLKNNNTNDISNEIINNNELLLLHNNSNNHKQTMKDIELDIKDLINSNDWYSKEIIIDRINIQSIHNNHNNSNNNSHLNEYFVEIIVKLIDLKSYDLYNVNSLITNALQNDIINNIKNVKKVQILLMLETFNDSNQTNENININMNESELNNNNNSIIDSI